MRSARSGRPTLPTSFGPAVWASWDSAGSSLMNTASSSREHSTRTVLSIADRYVSCTGPKKMFVFCKK